MEIGFAYLSRNCLWQKRLRPLRSLDLLFLLQMVQKKRKEATHHRREQSSQRPAQQGIPLLQNCEVALERISDPLGARVNILPASVGSAPTWSESLDDIQNNANLTLSCRLLERAPTASQGTRWPFDIVLLTPQQVPPKDPLPAC